MNRDLEPLRHPLTPSPEPGLEAVDPRLIVITDLADRAQYAEAAERIEELLSEGVYDIRPLSYYFFQAFLEDGFEALPVIFDAIETCLGENYHVIGPTKRRAENFDRRLAWLFETFVKTIEYHETKRTPEWAQWQSGLTVGTLEQGAHASQMLVEKIAAGPWASAGRMLGRVRDWLKARADLLTAEALSVHPPPVDAKKLSALPSAAKTEENPAFPSRLRVELAASHHFTELCSKLRAFEVLIEKGEHEKAALVADDLLRIIENFDPRSYFPELFAGFGALFSKHILKISNHFDQRESPAWKAMAQFYQVDLKSFVEG